MTSFDVEEQQDIGYKTHENKPVSLNKKLDHGPRNDSYQAGKLSKRRPDTRNRRVAEGPIINFPT